jgi:hypothetical protein
MHIKKVIMLSFHNKQSIKTKYLKRVHLHRVADEIVKGKYWEEGKGCAVGCTIHSSDHNSYEKELGIPEWLARVEDTLFEGMSLEAAKAWPEKFLKEIPLGVDLNQIKVPFTVYILESARESMHAAKFDKKKNPRVVAAIKQCDEAIDKVIAYHESGDSAAHSAAHSAAYSAASAADSAASAARSATSAARSATSAASAARSAAYSAVFEKFAKKLLKLLKGCK